MKHEITIRTLKRHAKMLDGRGAQRTSIGFFESDAVATTAHDGVKAAERAYDEARAGETAAYHRVSGRLLAFQARIEKMDIAIRIEQKQYALQTARNTAHPENSGKCVEGASGRGGADGGPYYGNGLARQHTR